MSAGPPRASWDATGMAMASAMADRSACGVRRVGAAVASADWRVWSFGYNGPPSQFHQPGPFAGCATVCPQGEARFRGDLHGDGEPRCVSVHAEVNALMQSDRKAREGGTMFVTAGPCWKCAAAIANSGVARLVCPRFEAERAIEGMRVTKFLSDCELEVVPWGT